jgi:hypothetical protein
MSHICLLATIRMNIYNYNLKTMTRLKIAYLLVASVILLYGCKGKDGAPGPQGTTGLQGPIGLPGATDKQIRMLIPTTLISFDGSQAISSSFESIQKFNIDYYPGVDSVIYTVNAAITGQDNKGYIELYNLTDNKSIDGSLITATDNQTDNYVLYQSGNLLKGLPHKEITIGIRIKGEVSKDVRIYQCYLYLYRK